MKYQDLRDFLTQLEQQGELKRISLPVDPHLEITEIADRTLRAGGPALLFENPIGYSMPVLCNLFGTPKRVAMGMGQEDVSALREVGKLLAFLKEPAHSFYVFSTWPSLFPLLLNALQVEIYIYQPNPKPLFLPLYLLFFSQSYQRESLCVLIAAL